MNCIEHKQKGDIAGYGRLNWRGRLTGAHRVAYMKEHGLDHCDIAGLVIMHTCDNPRCINPQHLTLGTYQENTLDMLDKGRNVPTRKLSNDEVAYIREHYIKRDKEQGGRALAKRFGVDPTTISNIIKGKYYD